MDFLMRHTDIKMMFPNRIVAGRKRFCGISADYMNTLGDPFSYFVYHTKRDKCETYRKNIIGKDGKAVIMRFEKGDVFPLADSATSTLSLDYMRDEYPDSYTDVGFICGAYDRVLQDTKLCGCIKGDDIRHNCSSSFKVYLSKLRFRVINNLFHKEESGFSTKEQFSKKLTGRKIAFCFYALFFPIPVIDSFRLAVIYKNPTYVLHFIYLYYVCILIVQLGIQKMRGNVAENVNYGQ